MDEHVDGPSITALSHLVLHPPENKKRQEVRLQLSRQSAVIALPRRRSISGASPSPVEVGAEGAQKDAATLAVDVRHADRAPRVERLAADTADGHVRRPVASGREPLVTRPECGIGRPLADAVGREHSVRPWPRPAAAVARIDQ